MMDRIGPTDQTTEGRGYYIFIVQHIYGGCKWAGPRGSRCLVIRPSVYGSHVGEDATPRRPVQLAIDVDVDVDM